MRSLFTLATFVAAAQALYFYIDGGTPKCFYEELPKDTLVVGHYSAEEWDDRANMWQEHQGISIYITVDGSERPNSETSPSRQTPASSAGSSSSSSSSAQPAPGSCPICAHSSSSRSLP
ncbi:hypothetical protein M440DRAFT_1399551, partial [Trichoderma longibrachiatum ATCC 18648]